MVAVVVLVVVLCLRGNKLAAAPRAVAELDTLVVSVRPAVEADWLELPGAVSGDRYEIETYYDSSVRNYTHLYDKETYTSLWTAYPLSASYMGSEPRPGKWIYSTSIDEDHQVNLKNHSYNDSYARGHMIPNYFYKVVLRVKTSDDGVTSASTIGFWMEHRKYRDSFTNYAVSVDQIEQWTGFDFFVNLPDTIESSAESNTSWTNFQNF